MSFSSDYLVALNQVRANSPTIPRPRPINNKRNCIEEIATPILCNKCKAANPMQLCKGCKKISYCNETCQRTDVAHKMICVGISEENLMKIIIVKPKQNNTNFPMVKSEQKDYAYKSAESDNDDSFDCAEFAISEIKKFNSATFSPYKTTKSEEKVDHYQHSDSEIGKSDEKDPRDDYAGSVTVKLEEKDDSYDFTDSLTVKPELKDDGYDYSEIISEIELQTQGTKFSNVPYYFKYESELNNPPRKFRIIHNPNNLQSFTNSLTRNMSKTNASILAYDESVPNSLIELISTKFRISIKLGDKTEVKDENHMIRNLSPFEIYSSEYITLSASK